MAADGAPCETELVNASPRASVANPCGLYFGFCLAKKRESRRERERANEKELAYMDTNLIMIDGLRRHA